MNEFDLKHGIDVGRKRRFIVLLLLAAIFGVVLSVVTMYISPELMPRKTHSFAQGLLYSVYWFCAMTGMVLYLGYFCFKVLSWIDMPHAIAALRSVLFSVDPLQD